MPKLQQKKKYGFKLLISEKKCLNVCTSSQNCTGINLLELWSAEGLFIQLKKIFCCWITLICTTKQQWALGFYLVHVLLPNAMEKFAWTRKKSKKNSFFLVLKKCQKMSRKICWPFFFCHFCGEFKRQYKNHTSFEEPLMSVLSICHGFKWFSDIMSLA